jgi:hypothetical protein
MEPHAPNPSSARASRAHSSIRAGVGALGAPDPSRNQGLAPADLDRSLAPRRAASADVATAGIIGSSVALISMQRLQHAPDLTGLLWVVLGTVAGTHGRRVPGGWYEGRDAGAEPDPAAARRRIRGAGRLARFKRSSGLRGSRDSAGPSGR